MDTAVIINYTPFFPSYELNQLFLNNVPGVRLPWGQLFHLRPFHDLWDENKVIIAITLPTKIITHTN